MTDDTKPQDDQIPATGDGEGSDVSNAALRLVPLERPTDDADHDLVVEARRGNSRAFESLFTRHHGRVFAMCCRLLRDRAEVEDAVQQTFLEAWRSLHRFEGRSRFSTWITRIAIHTCLGFRRRLKRILFAADHEGAVLAATKDAEGPPTPLDGTVARTRRVAIDDVLQKLTAKKRVVFVLSELEGLTAPEIAEIVEIPEATVRTRLFHARKEFALEAERHPGFADVFVYGRGEGAR